MFDENYKCDIFAKIATKQYNNFDFPFNIVIEQILLLPNSISLTLKVI